MSFAQPSPKARNAALHAMLLLVGFFYLFPFFWVLGSSLKTPAGFFKEGLSIIPGSFEFGNYAQAWTRGQFGLYFGNTLFITLMTLCFTLLFSSMAGYVLARVYMPGKKLVIGLILATLFLPKGYTIVPIFEVVKSMGLLDTLWAVIVVQVGTGLIFSTFLYMGYFATLPREVEEAALIDGASFPRVYWSVMLPMTGPISATVALFTFMGSWNDFFIPLVFTLGRPENRTLAVGMYAFQGENSREWTLICAGAVITLLPIVALFVFLQRYFIEGLAGAVKG